MFWRKQRFFLMRSAASSKRSVNFYMLLVDNYLMHYGHGSISVFMITLSKCHEIKIMQFL